MKLRVMLLFPCLLAGFSVLGQPVTNQSQVNTSEYGGHFSVGISTGDCGFLNIPMLIIPLRVFLTEKVPLEFSPGLRPVINVDGKIFLNVALIGGATFYFTKDYIPAKDRVRMNGLFIKGGGSAGSNYNELIFGAGWSYERFRAVNKSRTFNLELGLGFIRIHNLNYLEIDGINIDDEDEFFYEPAIFWRIAWHFFLPKKS